MIREQITIWDLTTRIIHWGIALIVFLNLFVLEGGDLPHEWFGYAAAAFVLIRIFWGIKGGVFSRFVNFPLKPTQVFQFLKQDFFSRKSIPYKGHNPLASLVYILIWLLIICLAISGWMMGLDAFWGSDWLEETHEYFSLALEFLIIFHLVGILIDSIKYKRRTWLAMITGKRKSH